MSIEVHKVSKYYGKQKALNEISFKVNPGEIVGFVGPNGAGKTTAMKILTGYMLPSSGKAEINGKDVTEQSMEVRKTIGYLPEHNPLYEEMYIVEYLEYVAGLYGLKNIKERIEDLIGITGLEKERNKRITALSKGYRQRVGLAQAILHDPEVLILDEPTSGLDPNQIIEIRNLISSLGKEKTVLLSTHLMQEVEAICDRIIILNRGNIVADDKVANISRQLKDNRQTVLVEFNKELQEEELRDIPMLSDLKKVDDKTWILEGSGEEDIRQDVFDFAVKMGASVLSMQEKEKSLEEVFHEMTK
jgi:ABC-2 type transport system ATP-binding protein